LIDAVDRVLEERAALDRGFGATLVLSTFGHVLLAGVSFFVAWLGARAPRIREVSGFAVVMPRGGGGPSAPRPQPAAAVPPPPVAAPVAPAPKPEPPPKVLKPPKDEPKGLPALDSRKTRTPPPPRTPAAAAASTASSGTGAASVPGLDIQAPPGVGIPGGSDAGGDWYLAGVQRKIWMIWSRQIKSGFAQPIAVTLTITETGAVDDVRVVESGGVALLDSAAQRAVYSAAPFTPLPRSYGTNRLTIRAIFRPGT
jgi:TonB family protein